MCVWLGPAYRFSETQETEELVTEKWSKEYFHSAIHFSVTTIRVTALRNTRRFLQSMPG